MLRIVFKILLLWSVASISSADNTHELYNIGEKNAGKFRSELSQFPKVFTLKYRSMQSLFFGATYDDSKGEMRLPYGVKIVTEDWVFEDCKPNGSFKGKNSFGAQATIQRIFCKRLEIQDTDLLGATFSEATTIPMSPSEYRGLAKDDRLIEVEFDVGADVDQEVFTAKNNTWPGTVAMPKEKTAHIVRAYGRFRKITILSPDGKKVIASYKRIPDQNSSLDITSTQPVE